jgi:alpha-1,2-glucosyltransferase
MPTVQRVAIFSLVPILYATWLYQVNITLPEPYLDEVFHVPQAQAYCAGQFGRWDPKITTPPGLYLLSYLLHQAKHIIFGGTYCALANLRWLNSLVASFIIPAQVWDVYRQSEMGHDRSTSFHTVINIALFPLIFFFSGLYYTDVCSVSFVLGAYEYHLRSLRHAPASRKMDMLKIFATGLCALSMRQTNIFWVAIFLAGLHAIHQVKREDQPSSESTRSPWHEMEPRYDPPVSKAYLERMISSCLEVAADKQRLHHDCRHSSCQSIERSTFALAKPLAVPGPTSILLYFHTHQWRRSAG